MASMRVSKPSAAKSGIYSGMGSSIKGLIGGQVSDKSRALAVTVLRDVDSRQGLTLVHFSAQPEPLLTLIPPRDSSYPAKRANVEPRSGRV